MVIALGVDLKESPQVGPHLAAAKAVGAQRKQATGNIRSDLLGQGPHIVRSTDERTLFVGQHLSDVGRRGFGRVQHVPAIDSWASRANSL